MSEINTSQDLFDHYCMERVNSYAQRGILLKGLLAELAYTAGKLGLVVSQEASDACNQTLRLYVWKDVLGDYTPGIAFAFASSMDEAYQQVQQALDRQGFQVNAGRDWHDPVVHMGPVGYALHGGA